MSSHLVTGDNSSYNKNQSVGSSWQKVGGIPAASTKNKELDRVNTIMKDKISKLENRLISKIQHLEAHNNADIEKLKNEFSESIKKKDEEIAQLKALIANLQKSGDAVSQLKADINHLNVAHHTLEAKSNADHLNVKNTISQVHHEVAQLQKVHRALASNVVDPSKVATLEKAYHSLASKVGDLEDQHSMDRLHLGEDQFIPAQPVANGDAGVWKDAPLALSVNGGVVFYNTGYTDKKGYDVTIDRETGRLMIYTGK